MTCRAALPRIFDGVRVAVCWGLGVLMANLLPGQVNAAPITFITALPVASGEFVAREQVIVGRSGEDPGTSERDRRETAAVTALGYGISGEWAVFGVVPYRDIELRSTTGVRRASGLGDLSILLRYVAWRRDQRGGTLRVAPFIGIKAPTGSNNARDALGLLPSSVQIGSGSWDSFAGVVVTRQTLHYQFDGQLRYQYNTEADGFQAGSLLRLDGSFQYRVLPSEFSGGIPDFLYAVLEASLVTQKENRLAGAVDVNSGGTRLFLTPGIQYVTRRWILEGAVAIPVVENLHGTALEAGNTWRVGVRANF